MHGEGVCAATMMHTSTIATGMGPVCMSSANCGTKYCLEEISLWALRWFVCPVIASNISLKNFSSNCCLFLRSYLFFLSIFALFFPFERPDYVSAHRIQFSLIQIIAYLCLFSYYIYKTIFVNDSSCVVSRSLVVHSIVTSTSSTSMYLQRVSMLLSGERGLCHRWAHAAAELFPLHYWRRALPTEFNTQQRQTTRNSIIQF